jgi:hypothetical protein
MVMANRRTTMYAALQRIAQEDPGGYFAAIASKALAQAGEQQ